MANWYLFLDFPSYDFYFKYEERLLLDKKIM